MATVLNLVHGSTTIQLNAGTYALLEYTPRAPEEREIVVETAFADGGERPVAAYRNVSEVARVALLGDGAAATVRAAMAEIALALRLARRRQERGLGERVYVEYQPDGYAETYRCEVLGGRVQLADEATGWQWSDRNIEIRIGWQRRFCWEGPEQQIYFRDIQWLVFDAELADTLNLIGDYTGLTGVTLDNSTAGVLYLLVFSDEQFDPAWRIVIFADAGYTQQVGHSEWVLTSGVVNIEADNGSGLGGKLSLVTGTETPQYEPVVARWKVDDSGISVWNHCDRDDGHVNYLDVLTTDVAGDLPTPLRLEMTNWYNSTNRTANVLLALNVLSAPDALEHVLEGEAASGGTTAADATCSGGARQDVSWSVTTETTVLTWELSTALLNACGGNYFRVLARFATPPAFADVWVRLRVKMSLTTLWEGPARLLSNVFSLQDLGVVQLPPYLVGAGDVYPLSLEWAVQRQQAGTHTFSLDWVQLLPLDGWRKLTPRGYGLPFEARLVDDGPDELVYSDQWESAGKLGHYVASGRPLQAWPQTRQRIYFLQDAMTGSAAIERLLNVKVFYRPRRLTV